MLSIVWLCSHNKLKPNVTFSNYLIKVFSFVIILKWDLCVCVRRDEDHTWDTYRPQNETINRSNGQHCTSMVWIYLYCAALHSAQMVEGFWAIVNYSNYKVIGKWLNSSHTNVKEIFEKITTFSSSISNQKPNHIAYKLKLSETKNINLLVDH